MPLLRYFFFVGGTLIALLLVANVALPTAPLPGNLSAGADLPPIRIKSERKLPERVVIDTSVALPTQAAAAPVMIAQAKPHVQIPAQAAAPVMQTKVQASAPPAISPKARVREAFAQLPREEESFEPKMSDMATVVVSEPKMYPARQPIKHKVAAKPRTAHPLMVAQQPHFGGFNSTW